MITSYISKKYIIILSLLFGIMIFLFLKTILMVENLKNIKNEFTKLQSNLSSLLNHEFQISKENLQLSNDEVQKISKIKHSWLQSLGKFSPSTNPMEYYFNLKHNIDFLKQSIKTSNIEFPPECYFGFKKYLNCEKLSTVENINTLEIQLLITQYLINLLIQSAPKEIFYIKRQSLKNELELDDEIFSDFDYITNIHTLFSSFLFKISFLSNTETARIFINKIISTESPVFIREIEVSEPPSVKNNPFISENYSIFKIVLEGLVLNDPML